MKKVLLAIILIFTLNGCKIEDYLTEKNTEKEFKSLCNRYTLTICNDLQVPEYNNADIFEITAVSYDILYEPKNDNKESYDYMESAPHKGDCEDWVITFIENNLRTGNFTNGQARWVFGQREGDYHSWALITVGEETVLFDNWNRYGTDKEKAYSEKYREEFTVYRY